MLKRSVLKDAPQDAQTPQDGLQTRHATQDGLLGVDIERKQGFIYWQAWINTPQGNVTLASGQGNDGASANSTEQAMVQRGQDALLGYLQACAKGFGYRVTR